LLWQNAVAAELADIDLDLNNTKGLAKEEVLSKISRLKSARTVFEETAGNLGTLPGSMAQQVVRYYGRLDAKAAEMEIHINTPGFSAFINAHPRSVGA
jgi:hypothetical protein